MLLATGRRLGALSACLLSRGLAVGVQQEEGLGEKVKHAAENIAHSVGGGIHKVEEKVSHAVHDVEERVHELREQAREEAERGMYTADDIREAAYQMEHSRDKPNRKRKEERQYKPSPEEAMEEELLDEAAQDFGSPARQKDMGGLRKAMHEPEEKAEEEIKHFGQDVKKYPEHH